MEKESRGRETKEGKLIRVSSRQSYLSGGSAPLVGDSTLLRAVYVPYSPGAQLLPPVPVPDTQGKDLVPWGNFEAGEGDFESTMLPKISLPGTSSELSF